MGRPDKQGLAWIAAYASWRSSNGRVGTFLARLTARESVDAAKEARRMAVDHKRQQDAEERARLRDLRKRPCAAQTRAGHPCRCKGIGRGGRCKFHGGASTGPRSQDGRARIAAAQRKRWAA